MNITTQILDYETITHVTQSVPFLIIIGIIWFLVGLVLYLVIAGFTKARTSDGRKLKSSMLSHGNAIIPIIIWVIQGVSILFLLIFPFWAKLI